MLNNENYGYLVHPLFQFMDANLKPLTSAYLKVFYAGTSSSAYTYSDWEGTLNASDIMLSMNGSANVIAEKNKAYKVMLCDALHPPSDPIWVKNNLYVINSEIEVIDNTAIKDNAYDDVTDPVRPNNITDIEQLTFFRNVGADANYTMVESEARIYGVLIPHPSMEADIRKVPMYKNGNQIEWDNVLEEAPNDGLSYARTSNAWNVIGSSIDITDDFELINGMSTKDVGNAGRFKVLYMPATDMVQITGDFFSPSSKNYDSWVHCLKYNGDFLSFNSVVGGQSNIGLGEPPAYTSNRVITLSAFITDQNYSDRVFAFKGLIGHNNMPFYGAAVLFTCYGCRAAKLAEIAAAE